MFNKYGPLVIPKKVLCFLKNKQKTNLLKIGTEKAQPRFRKRYFQNQVPKDTPTRHSRGPKVSENSALEIKPLVSPPISLPPPPKACFCVLFSLCLSCGCQSNAEDIGAFQTFAEFKTFFLPSFPAHPNSQISREHGLGGKRTAPESSGPWQTRSE